MNIEKRLRRGARKARTKRFERIELRNRNSIKNKKLRAAVVKKEQEQKKVDEQPVSQSPID